MEVKRVGIIGCGFMGSGIVQVCAEAGYIVKTYDINPEMIEKGITGIKKRLMSKAEKRLITKKQVELTINRIKHAKEIEDMHDCDLIIEAIKENMDDKKDLFKRLDGLCPPKTIFATNTSCLSVTEMATATSRPEKVLGIHFFTPPPLMEGLEIVETILVDKNTLETAVRFGKSLGKTVFVVKDTPGFIANALMIPYVLNAIRMLENKIASKENIDVAMVKGLGYPIGPIALADYFGLDILYSIAKSMYEDTKDPLLNPPLILKHMVMAGRLGRKTGKGFYDYDSFNA